MIHATRQAGAVALLAMVAAAACDDPADPPNDPPPDPPAGLDLAMPIGGTMNEDWYVTYYVDGQSGSGVLDYACGPRSYDGHKGVDLVLPSFAAMDAGVPVLAAASGTVTWTHDGEPDRNKEWLPGVQWNAVAIDHGDGYEAVYGHFMTGSIVVSSGDAVEAGDTLGLVGSSGRSSMPHLHFELSRDGQVRDPFAGECGADEYLWGVPFPYQDAFALIDVGLTTDDLGPGLGRVKDPPSPAASIVPGEMLYAWVQYHNVALDATTRWVVRRPDGSVHRDYSASHPFATMSWWWYAMATDDFEPAGTWNVEFLYEGELVAERSFAVADAPVAVRDTAGPPARDGFGGGVVR